MNEILENYYLNSDKAQKMNCPLVTFYVLVPIIQCAMLLLTIIQQLSMKNNASWITSFYNSTNSLSKWWLVIYGKENLVFRKYIKRMLSLEMAGHSFIENL